ncbi:MAG: cytochrome c class [Dehalococcoidia bacterium]|nr:cytochrome c class [Dehalococcoidia bacterium]
MGQAPLLYWVLAGIAMASIVGFMVWALYFPTMARPSNRGYHVLGGVVVLVFLASLLAYIAVPASGFGKTPTQRAWDWKAGEVLSDPGNSGLQGEPYRGYQIYISQGCIYCHSMYVRLQDLKTGYTHFPMPLWSTQRNAPDLTIEGKRVPLMQWHIDHLKDPRKFQPLSIMPTYRYLSERQLADLAAFLVSLGNDPQALRAGQVGPKEPPGLSPEAQAGLALAQRMGCPACHTTNGMPSVGPTWAGLFGKDKTFSDGSKTTVEGNYIQESILDPGARVVQGFQPIMPSFAGRLSSEDIAAIIEYIKSLKETP